MIAIDGPAASGKGTLARALAEQLNYAYLDTGALYRATALEALEAGGNPEDETTAVQGAATLSEKIAQAGPVAVLGNPALRTDDVGQAASKVASIQAVRDALTDFQRNFATNPGESYKGAILDGRDIGTVICPGAAVKLFVTASDTVRAERRFLELTKAGHDTTYEQVLADVRARDARDTDRDAAPMRAASDAVVLDTSEMTIDQAVARAVKEVSAKFSA